MKSFPLEIGRLIERLDAEAAGLVAESENQEMPIERRAIVRGHIQRIRDVQARLENLVMRVEGGAE